MIPNILKSDLYTSKNIKFALKIKVLNWEEKGDISSS
jgi:hypothetical protein